MGLVECQDVSNHISLHTTLSDCDSFDVGHSLFSQGCCHLCCSQRQLPTSDNSLRCVPFFMKICFTFTCVEAFHLEDVFFSMDLDFTLNRLKTPRQANFRFEYSLRFGEGRF